MMQDWHQKLHNNTTPDDVAICEAYIKFLQGNGDNGAYWRHLTDNGITRERLESFDRAIKVSFDHTALKAFFTSEMQCNSKQRSGNAREVL